MSTVTLTNVNALLPGEGLTETSLRIEDGCIAGIGVDAPQTGKVVDGNGLMAMPGIVDIHGDAFERQIMPRANVSFRLDVALNDTDQQMISNGITTAYHGVTFSWEPGLRGRENCERMLGGVAALQPYFGCDTRIHLRFETFNLDAVDDVIDWMNDGLFGIFAFNDHTPEIVDNLSNASHKVKRYTDRTGLSEDQFKALAQSVYERRGDVTAAIGKLASAARLNNVPQFSHDDRTPEMRRFYHELGCEVSEFPMNEETAEAARILGNPIVLGAPNVMRGGSHNGAVNAADMIAQDLCNILASDYYYPAQLIAAFRLVDDGVLDIERAWNLVSLNPARAAGLTDRGEIRIGQRADLVLVDTAETEFPRIVATMTEGRMVHQTMDMSSTGRSGAPQVSQRLSA
ncbi:MAG: alpha-D-ribose 1-methylphosphonate 5-triphosphate diphosphatase [Alphaproteobacteria bacterium]